MDSIRLLGVAPYTGLRDMMVSAAENYPDIYFEAHIGDLEEGTKIARSLQKNFDAVISGGGTAEMISNAVDIPVIAIELSGYDILRAVRLAQNYNGKTAIAGFPSITSPARLVCELLDFNAEIITYNRLEDVADCLKRLKTQGVNLVIGDTITFNGARHLGINGILITSGQESIAKAFNDACSLYRQHNMIKRHDDMFIQLLDQLDHHYILMNEEGTILYDNHPDKSAEELSRYIPQLMSSGPVTFIRKRKDTDYLIKGKPVTINGYPHALFEKKQIMADACGSGAISIRSHADGDYLSLDSMIATTTPMAHLLNRAKGSSQTSLPIWIEGETGTGKDTLAFAIYMESTVNNKMFMSINCQEIDNKTWNQLFKKMDSPLNGLGSTLYFSNMHSLPAKMATELYSFINQSGLLKRNRLIFSSAKPLENMIEEGLLPEFYYKKLSDHLFKLLPLRNRTEDISSLTSIFLNKLNTQYGHQVIGFDKGAIALLCSFSWPQNIDQLQKILLDLVLMTSTSLISLENVKSTLENHELKTSLISPDLDFQNKTLFEIEREIIRKVLAEEGFNQSQTARRLGISRSTLWRMIRD